MGSLGSFIRFEEWKRELRALAEREGALAFVSDRVLSRRRALRDGFAARMSPREFYRRYVARDDLLEPDTPEL
jgi:hypothetical protein